MYLRSVSITLAAASTPVSCIAIRSDASEVMMARRR
jgi:hypothetical protein